ncbi:MAG: efflux RND transporter periplasmic adaptor subunit [Gemmatimonadetes bacterium]|nr:efflux RND transporter periplasmic adaptor subunit [Gemmatimonadota bacterium]
MTGLQKGFIALIVVGVLAAAAVISMRTGSGRGAAVRMADIDRQDLVATVTASGNIRARRSVDISSDVAARVADLLVEEGQNVEVGDDLLRLDRTQLEASRSRAQASVSQAQAQAAQQSANLTRQRREYDRIRGLWMRDSLLVSRQQVEDAETNLEVARANMDAAEYGVEVAEAALDEAEDRLAKTVFRAPIAGKVTRLNVEVGETVVVGTMNNAGSLILTISDLSVVEVVVQMDETDVPRLALGDSAEVDIDAFPDQTFTARVTEIGNSAIRPPSQNAASGQQQAIDFEVVLTLDPTDVELRPDLSATASIVTDMRDDAVAVPIIALTVREDSTRATTGETPEVEGVFVVEAGTASFRPVTVGIAGDEFFEVLDGLEPGETVVSGPYQTIRTLRDGDPVRREEELSDDARNDAG